MCSKLPLHAQLRGKKWLPGQVKSDVSSLRGKKWLPGRVRSDVSSLRGKKWLPGQVRSDVSSPRDKKWLPGRVRSDVSSPRDKKWLPGQVRNDVSSPRDKKWLPGQVRNDVSSPRDKKWLPGQVRSDVSSLRGKKWLPRQALCVLFTQDNVLICDCFTGCLAPGSRKELLRSPRGHHRTDLCFLLLQFKLVVWKIMSLCCQSSSWQGLSGGQVQELVWKFFHFKGLFCHSELVYVSSHHGVWLGEWVSVRYAETCMYIMGLGGFVVVCVCGGGGGGFRIKLSVDGYSIKFWGALGCVSIWHHTYFKWYLLCLSSQSVISVFIAMID